MTVCASVYPRAKTSLCTLLRRRQYAQLFQQATEATLAYAYRSPQDLSSSISTVTKLQAYSRRCPYCLHASAIPWHDRWPAEEPLALPHDNLYKCQTVYIAVIVFIIVSTVVSGI